MELVIVPNMEADIVLGGDQLTKYNAIINYEQKLLKIDENWIEISIASQEGRNSNTDIVRNWNVYCEEGNDNSINNCDDINDEFNENIIIDCGEKYLNKVKELLERYDKLISKESRVAKEYVHKIEVKNVSNFKVKTYPIPYRYKDQVKKEIEKLLNDGIIEYSNTQFINPIVVVRKKNNEIRLSGCQNYK